MASHMLNLSRIFIAVLWNLTEQTSLIATQVTCNPPDLTEGAIATSAKNFHFSTPTHI